MIMRGYVTDLVTKPLMIKVVCREARRDQRAERLGSEPMITVIEYRRSPSRFIAARGASARATGKIGDAVAGSLAPLRLINRPDPRRPGPEWGRVRPLLSGICGSDLALLTGRSSPYLSPVVSMPFVPGHEVVGQLLDDVGDLRA